MNANHRVRTDRDPTGSFGCPRRLSGSLVRSNVLFAGFVPYQTATKCAAEAGWLAALITWWVRLPLPVRRAGRRERAELSIVHPVTQAR
jgi:hypothetical protein